MYVLLNASQLSVPDNPTSLSLMMKHPGSICWLQGMTGTFITTMG